MQGNLRNAFCSMELLAHRLASMNALSAVEWELLLEPRHSSRAYSAGSEIRDPGGDGMRQSLIVSGWASREHVSHSGRRQLLSILLPGDLIGDPAEGHALDAVEIVALSGVRTIGTAGFMSIVNGDADRYSRIASGLSALRCGDETRLLDHIVRLGSQPAPQRIASFVLELFARCRVIGFVTGSSFPMPLTQEMLGGALGLSVVHVNRVIHRLKADRLISLQGGRVTIDDAIGLASLAELMSG